MNGLPTCAADRSHRHHHARPRARARSSRGTDRGPRTCSTASQRTPLRPAVCGVRTACAGTVWVSGRAGTVFSSALLSVPAAAAALTLQVGTQRPTNAGVSRLHRWACQSVVIAAAFATWIGKNQNWRTARRRYLGGLLGPTHQRPQRRGARSPASPPPSCRRLLPCTDRPTHHHSVMSLPQARRENSARTDTTPPPFFRDHVRPFQLFNNHTITIILSYIVLRAKARHSKRPRALTPGSPRAGWRSTSVGTRAALLSSPRDETISSHRRSRSLSLRQPA